MSPEKENTSAMATGGNNLHVVFLPSFLPGHMMSLVQLARLFAARGVISTIITTVHNALTFQPDIETDTAAGYPITVHTIEFPASEVGLPIGIENIRVARSKDEVLNVFNGMNLLQTTMEEVIRDISPDCIFSDMFFPWTVDLADELKIPRLFYNPSSLFSECVRNSLKVNTPHEKVKSETESFVVPDLPDEISLKKCQIEEHLRAETILTKIMDKIEESEKRSYGVVHNSFIEIEPAYVDHAAKIKGRKIWPLGPFFEFFDEEKKPKEKDSFLRWLDDQNPKSVIYICFGSMVRLQDAQITEIAFALEESKKPFVWVVRTGDDGRIGGLPEGFEERIKKENKGLILTGWAPQVEILKHPAVGGMFSHCGWNSILEPVVAGVPLITWPLIAEQFYNEKLVELLGIGVGLGADGWNETTVITSPIIEKGRIVDVIKKLTSESAVAESIRYKSKELAIKAKEAVKPGGSSFSSLSTLIQELEAIKLAPK